MNTEITDYTLQNYYKRKLRESQYAPVAKKLNSQVWCAVRTIRVPMHTPGVFVIANNVEARYWGVQLCKSPWSCPVCSARRMSKEATRIACAIDALKKQHKAGFMITFSVPHYHDFSCRQVYDILRETWKNFAHASKSKTMKYDIFAQFNNEFNCKYRIRVGEFTWGHYGWHPHYHCLFFVDEKRLQEVLDWQERLSARWSKLTEKATRKILKRDNYCEDVDKFVDRFIKKARAKKHEDKCDAFISTKDGKVLQANSSQYICGWGADKELTGNLRKEASHKGHYTPYQLLQMAYDYDKKDQPEKADKYFNLYVEYAEATLKTYRVRMSPNLKKIVADWQLTHEYTETFKKKLAERHTSERKWRIVCWFKEQQWYDICRLNLDPTILQLAKQINGKQLIETLLLEYQIDIRQNIHPDIEFFKEYFNAA